MFQKSHDGRYIVTTNNGVGAPAEHEFEITVRSAVTEPVTGVVTKAVSTSAVTGPTVGPDNNERGENIHI